MELISFWLLWIQSLVRQTLEAPSVLGYMLGISLWFLLGLLIPIVVVYLLEPFILPPRISYGTRWLVRLSSGLGLVGIVTTYLGAVSMLNRLNIFLVLGAVVILTFFLRMLVPHHSFQNSFSSCRRLTFEMIVAGAVLLVVLPLVFYHAVGFPVMHWDSILYMAVIAKNLYLHGGFPDLVGVSLGLGMDTGYPPLFSAVGAYFYVLLGKDNDIFFRLLSPLFYVIFMGAMYALGKMWGGRRLGLIGLLVVALTPIAIYGGFQETYNIMLGAWVMLALFFVLRAERYDTWRDWLLAGWYLGLTGLTSYNGYYPVLALLLAAVIVRLWRWYRIRQVSWRGVVLMSSMISILILPWWTRNYIVFGTPVQPFLSSSALLAPFNIIRTETNISTIHRDWMGVAAPSSEHWFSLMLFWIFGFPGVSLLSLLGVPSALRWGRAGIYIVLLAGTYWLSPILQPAHHERFMLTYLPALGFLAALVIWKALRGLPRWQFSLSIAVLAYTLLVQATPLLEFGKWYHLLGGPHPGVSREWVLNPKNRAPSTALAMRFYQYEDWRVINDLLGPDKKLALTGLSPNYYLAGGDLSKVFFLDSLEAFPLRSMHSPEQLRDFFLYRGVHLIYWMVYPIDAYSYEGFTLETMLGGPLFPRVGPHVYAVDGKV